jgi:putative inorganic carbon (HCO3(-)) transporter
LYFDVVPKIALMLFGAALLLLNLRRFESPVARMLTSGAGRIMAACLALQILSLVVSTCLSKDWVISLFGTGWRRLGAIEYAAIIVFAFLASAYLADESSRLPTLLRALCVSAILLGLYGILQYFGWDPFLDRESYRLLNGTVPVVRPPGTLGHATYFANYLSFLALVLAGLAVAERSTAWRIAAAFSVLVAGSALALTGTRAGLLGLAAGGLFLTMRLSRGIFKRRWILLSCCGAAVASVAFWFTPVGRHVRDRWPLDPAGGTRPLVWRDSLRMARSVWMVGAGPESFALVFPRYESLDLIEAYPDWNHESSHNVCLDALLSQGVPGLLALLALGTVAVFASFRWTREEPVAMGLAAGTIALFVSQQFTVFILPTALAFYLSCAVLAAGTAGRAAYRPKWKFAIRGLRLASLPLAALFLAVGAQICYVDSRWAGIHRALQLQRPESAMEQYSPLKDSFPPETGASLWYSRAVLDVTRQSPDISLRRQAWAQALDAASRAVEHSEDRPNAWYNLALVQWALGDASQAESSLRAASDAAPRWFKPHWLLAELLLASGRPRSAETENTLALSLAGSRQELLNTLSRIEQRLRSDAQRGQ